MMTTRWTPLADPRGGMRRVRDEMSRLLESLGQEGLAPAAGYPALNVWQDEGNIYVEAELPGMDLGALDISVTGDQLTLKGERKPPQVPDKAVWHRQERFFGGFSRSLTLPVLVDADKVQARLVNGVLTVTLPKSEAAKPKKIPVKAE